ncbi:Fic family protein [Paenochrobactrum pullorum]|uniref:Fic family protein n=1 Tax=Paenochrobactrum pullorum TaxID=1324351 RepID=UPI0035BC85B8
MSLVVEQLEIQNGFEQFDYGLEVIRQSLDPHFPFSLRESLILELQAIAVKELVQNPGQYRGTSVGITKSKHIPPEPHLVKNLVIEMCEYINNNLHEKSPFHLAAYIMWRHNWIHPFVDGNGRTSRMLSYIILCVALKSELPGSPTIPQQIQEDRSGYFAALEAADEAEANGTIDVSIMEELLKGMLANQLLSVIDAATGEGK